MPKLAKSEKRVRSASLDPSVLTTATSFFEDLPAKPKETLSLREAVTELKEPLQAALAKGYSYQDLAEVLGKSGIPISPATLKNYVPVGSRSGRRGMARTKSAAEPIAPTHPEPVAEVEDEPVVKASRMKAAAPKVPVKRGPKPKKADVADPKEDAKPKKPEIVSLQKGTGTRGRPKKSV